MDAGPGFEAWRRGRISQPASRYFLTLTTQDRLPGLSTDAVATASKHESSALEADLSWQVHAAVMMPDHPHLLITLGHRLTLGQALGRLKAKTAKILARTGLCWQGNYHDHHLRPDDLVENVARYVFLNPYRANLVPPDAKYEWTWRGTEEPQWLMTSADDGRPFPERLQ